MSDRAKEVGHRRQSKERAWRSEEASTHMISGVSKVVIEVEDQDRAKAFWIETMGFELAQDAPYQEERWLEVRSPDRATNLVLELRTVEATERRVTPEHLPTSNVMFRCDDLTATYEEVSARGVEFPQPPVEQPFGSWSMFNDPEGNRFALEQTHWPS
jgi:predicted enzyme related to lactoylglutathione lyase